MGFTGFIKGWGYFALFSPMGRNEGLLAESLKWKVMSIFWFSWDERAFLGRFRTHQDSWSLSITFLVTTLQMPFTIGSHTK